MVTPVKIVGILLVKNEDVYVEQAVRNIIHFCDTVIIADNYSDDLTYKIVSGLAEEYPNRIELHRVKKVHDSPKLIEGFADSNTWMFGVDGDEIYDPSGLSIMREQLKNGAFADYWLVFGNVLHCISLDPYQQIAEGYLAPPSRSMTKLYNFSLIHSWVNCPFVLSGGSITFKNEYHKGLRFQLNQELAWEQSYFRCLHTVFVSRSSLQRGSALFRTRLNVSEIRKMKYDGSKGRFYGMRARIIWELKRLFRQDWKNRNYRKGSLVTKNVSAFFPG